MYKFACLANAEYGAVIEVKFKKQCGPANRCELFQIRSFVGQFAGMQKWCMVKKGLDRVYCSFEELRTRVATYS